MPNERIKIEKITVVKDFVNIEAGGKKYAGNHTYAGSEAMKDWVVGQEVEIAVKTVGDKNYISIPKAGGGGGNKSFAVKDETWQKRKASLDAAISSIAMTGKTVTLDNIVAGAEKLYEYINKK